MTRVALLVDPIYMSLQGGVPRYTLQLAYHLLLQPDVELCPFTLYSPEQRAANPAQEPLACTQSVGSRRIPRPGQYLLWHLLGQTGAAGAHIAAADVVHAPCFFVPPGRKRPLVITIHDMSYATHPQQHTWRNRLISASGMRRAVQDAQAFITDSEATAQDLERIAGVPRRRIFPVPLAADARFQPTIDPGVTAKYGITSPYVLYAGTLEPRKNIPALLQAFAALDHAALDRARGAEVKLVLAGGKGWLYQEIFDLAQRLQLGNRIIFTGFVPDEDLPALYSAAEVFVYPSLYEGFGLPPLEAMQCGTPVITSNLSSLPEVVGDAAIQVSPYDAAELQRQLWRVLTEPGLRAELSGKGLERAVHFSWQKTAALTAEVYRFAEASGGK